MDDANRRHEDEAMNIPLRTNRAVVLEGPDTLALRELNVPAPGFGAVVARSNTAAAAVVTFT